MLLSVNVFLVFYVFLCNLEDVVGFFAIGAVGVVVDE
jgi:hypothetical protein